MMETPKDSLEKKVFKAEETLIFCNFKECPERGEYIYCYFDTHKNCNIYANRKLYKEQ